MSYTSYTDDNVFTEPRLNAFCDFLFENILEAFPPEPLDPDNDFVLQSTVLSGRAAAILQGEEGEISNVTFVCGRVDIYNWLAENVGKKLFNCKQITFKDRILFYPHEDLFFEIWFTPDEPVFVEFGKITIQKITDIPTLTL